MATSAPHETSKDGSTRVEVPDLEPREATLLSGTITELPVIRQKGGIDEQGLRSEAFDYVENVMPHKTVSPRPVASQRDSSNNLLSPLMLECQGASGSSYSLATPPEATESVSSPGRRSVQFACTDMVVEPSVHGKQGLWDTREAIGRLRTRWKGFAMPGSPQGPRSPNSLPSIDFESLRSPGSSPVVNRRSSRAAQMSHHDNETDVDADADAEETADEAGVSDRSAEKKKKRRLMRRNKKEPVPSLKTPQLGLVQSETSAGPSRRRFMRRATASDLADHRGGLSEGEGRDRLAVRGSSWTGGNREEEADEAGGPAVRRLGHLRRMSVFGGGTGGGMSEGEGLTPRRPFFPGERATTYGAQKWRQVKNTLKALRQKKDERFDLHKSTELMAELRAGAPAVLMFASMMQRDEHGNKRIPVLLEQVKLHIRDSRPVQDKNSERHWLFTIDLEYGSGPSRMEWTIQRTIKEILNLHWKYKLALRNDNIPTTRLDLGAHPKQPKFPLSAFPYLRGMRGLDDQDEGYAGAGDDGDRNVDTPSASAFLEPASLVPDDNAPGGNLMTADGTATDGEDRAQPRRRTSRMNMLYGGRRKHSSLTEGGNGSRGDLSQLDPTAARRRYVERQQRMIENYLQEMVRWLIFRADSNRLCRFLELSALGVRLAAEGSYHGKECYLHIQSSKGLDFRRVLTPSKVIARHTRKWFLVRHSYIACVDSPENMDVYDVYLVDAKFKLISKKHKKSRFSRGSCRAGAQSEGQVRQQAGDKDTDAAVGVDAVGADLAQLHLSGNGEHGEDGSALKGKRRNAGKHHTLKMLTSERKVKLFSRNQHLIRQFEESITEMMRHTPWHLRNRFGSFAPVRNGVHAQPLVDGRDYMWNVSRAISMAEEVIYIHDWWLSPELYMRRPACISQKWRLDRLLQRKAREGVKIFVIVYRNVEAAVPIDSEHTKFSLLNLHPNIFVQRSPNQFKKNQFFFAHHEKLCIVDHNVAFLGGIDLCFGRWDSPQHLVTDDKPTGFEDGSDTPKDAAHCQLFPGKDYSNPRVQDFFRLREPYEEMYDRSRVPRMPWHDVAMQVVGQPARDLTRHFVQRWNYVRRGRNPTRPTPFLLPPPDVRREELEAMGLTGTCELQILRSASTWSLGTDDTECSIQSAYIRMIHDSEHFVYVENQFFITSTETLNTRMTNRIGDALVERVLRAHGEDQDWRCVVLIPLMPGFQNEVNEQDGTSVRLILQCQYRSICRGEYSIFGRLRAAGIDPEDYIQFFSLRQWGKLANGTILTTEQLYIHAKCIIADDRVALIGSANINERSMLGNRDSEIAAIVRDTDMLWSTMAGKPYRVGRFAFALRMRLMREHLGLDVDEILEAERMADPNLVDSLEAEMDCIYRDDHDERLKDARNDKLNAAGRSGQAACGEHQATQLGDTRPDMPKFASNSSPMSEPAEQVELSDQNGIEVAQERDGRQAVASLDEGRDLVTGSGHEVMVHDISADGRGTMDHPNPMHEHAQDANDSHEGAHSVRLPPVPPLDRRTSEQLGLLRANQLPSLPVADEIDIGGPPAHVISTGELCHGLQQPLMLDIRMADIDKDCMRDPLNTAFYEDVWCRAAENNTKLYRRVFRCMPDSEVTNWAEYKEFKTYSQRFKESMDGHHSSEDEAHNKLAQTGAGSGISAPSPELLMRRATLGPKSVRGAAKVESDDVSAADEKKGLENKPEEANADMNSINADVNSINTDVNSINADVNSINADVNSINADVNSINEKADTTVRPKDPAKEAFRGTTERHANVSHSEKSPGSPNSTSAPAQPVAAGSDGASGAACSITAAIEGGETAGGNSRNLPDSQRRRRRATTRDSRRGFLADNVLSPGEAEDLLNVVQGHLVQFPYDWLIVEETNGNWLFQVDQVAPLQIYN